MLRTPDQVIEEYTHSTVLLNGITFSQVCIKVDVMLCSSYDILLLEYIFFYVIPFKNKTLNMDFFYIG